MSRMQQLYEEVELPLLPILSHMELRGAYVNQETVKDLKKTYTEEQAKLPHELRHYTNDSLNLNSREAVSMLLFEHLKLTPPHRAPITDKGFVSTNTKQVLDQMEHHPVIEIVKTHRMFQKLLGYVKSLERPHPVSQRVHTNFNQAKVKTGRLSSSNPINFQNIPSRSDFGKLLRGAFEAPDGYVFVIIDYDQMEYRAETSLSEDPVKMEVYKSGGDLHRRTLDVVFGEEPDVLQKLDFYRKLAKIMNFLAMYRGGALTLSGQIGRPVDVCHELIRAQRELFAGSERYYHEYCDEVETFGFAETLMGRRRNLPGVNSSLEYVREEAFRQAYSQRIQGSCADVMKRSMVKSNTQMQDNYLDASCILQVHDEVVIEVIPDHVPWLFEILKKVFMDVPEFDNLSMEVKIEVGKNWLDTVEVKIQIKHTE